MKGQKEKIENMNWFKNPDEYLHDLNAYISKLMINNIKLLFTYL